MVRPTRRAVRANLGGFPIDSRYSRASLVCSSTSHHCSMSVPDTSSLSPKETRVEIPTPSRDRCSTSTKPVPPVDCKASPAVPAAGWRAANVASRPMPGLATPKLAGPTIRMPWRRQMLQQLGAGRAGQSGRDHHQGLDAPPPAVLGDTEHGRRRDGDDRQVNVVGQRGR